MGIGGKMEYFSKKNVDIGFDAAISRLTEELKKEGFGILTEIDVQKTMKAKLDIDFRRYKILGACNPPFAHKALTLESNIGVLLPCNWVVQELPSGKVEISTINPLVSMRGVNNENLAAIAGEVQQKLSKVLEAI